MTGAPRTDWKFSLHKKDRETAKRLIAHHINLFRHTVKQYARRSDIHEGVQRQIIGHSAGDVADEYGTGYPLHQVVGGMRRYRGPELKLPEPRFSV